MFSCSVPLWPTQCKRAVCIWWGTHLLAVRLSFRIEKPLGRNITEVRALKNLYTGNIAWIADNWKLHELLHAIAWITAIKPPSQMGIWGYNIQELVKLPDTFTPNIFLWLMTQEKLPDNTSLLHYIFRKYSALHLYKNSLFFLLSL